jgi:signal transduction histidine kinase
MSFRIATTIVGALLATQALNFLFFRLTPPPRGHLFAARATARALAATVEQAFAPAGDGALIVDPQWAPFLRLQRTERVAGGRPLDDRAPPDMRRFFATLLALAPSAREIRLLDDGPPWMFGWPHPGFGDPGHGLPPGPPTGGPAGFPESFGRSVIFIPSSARPTALAEGGPLRDDEPELWFPGPGHFALRGPDGRWLVVEDFGWLSFREWRTLEPLLWLLATMAGVLAISQWFAARETRPLRALAGVAERIGRDRGHVKVDVRQNYEVAALSDALNRMQGRIQAFLDERTLMLGALSHDLRTPLTRMRLGAEAIAPPALRGEFVAEIEEMRMMIEAALNFARGEAVAEDWRPTDLAVMARSLCDDLSDRGGMATFDGADHCIVDCQPLAVKRALANLIDNAWKFGGAAEVTLRETLSETEEIVTIEVADHGPGIPPDRIDDALAPFRRLEGAASGKPGAGLGLTIARDVALSQGGALDLSPNHPRGLRATLRLPRRRGGDA